MSFLCFLIFILSAFLAAFFSFSRSRFDTGIRSSVASQRGMLSPSESRLWKRYQSSEPSRNAMGSVPALAVVVTGSNASASFWATGRRSTTSSHTRKTVYLRSVSSISSTWSMSTSRTSCRTTDAVSINSIKVVTRMIPLTASHRKWHVLIPFDDPERLEAGAQQLSVDNSVCFALLRRFLCRAWRRRERRRRHEERCRAASSHFCLKPVSILWWPSALRRINTVERVKSLSLDFIIAANTKTKLEVTRTRQVA